MKTFLGVAGSFLGFVAVIVYMRAKEIITFEVGMLMLVALFGLYIGFGFLIVVHRFTSKLE